VACWAHCRRNIFDVWKTTDSPVAKEALDRIAAFYAIEAKAQLAPPAERLAHRTDTAPLLDAFFTWAEKTLAKMSAKSALAEAFRYTITRREALSRFLTDATEYYMVRGILDASDLPPDQARDLDRLLHQFEDRPRSPG
jgi:transposase